MANAKTVLKSKGMKVMNDHVAGQINPSILWAYAMPGVYRLRERNHEFALSVQ